MVEINFCALPELELEFVTLKSEKKKKIPGFKFFFFFFESGKFRTTLTTKYHTFDSFQSSPILIPAQFTIQQLSIQLRLQLQLTKATD